MKKISIIIPAYNEEKNIPIIRERIESVFSSLKDYLYEIIFVNDGSRDNTQKVLEDLSTRHKEVKYIELSRNFGHQAALKTGFEYTDANAIISMDADLQHPPEIIPLLIEQWEKGFDVVYTVREYNQNVSFMKKTTSDFYYKIISLLSDFKFEKGTSDFRLLDARIVYELKQNRESDLFLRGLVKWIGFRQVYVKFTAGDRNDGKSKYTLRKTLHLALNGVTSFSVKPLYLATYIGFFFSLLPILYLFYVGYSIIKGTEISGWASLIMTVVFFGGLQLIMLGIIGIYLGRTFKQVKNRPQFVVKSKNI